MKLSETELSPALRKDINLIEILNNIASILNNGRYQMRVITSVPTWTGEQGEHFLYISGTVRRFYYWDDTNSTWQFIEYPTSVSLTGQTGAIGATTIYTPAATGMYRVSVYMVCTTAGGGTLSATIKWTDVKQSQQASPAANVNLANAGEASSGSIYINSTAVAITYETAIAGASGSPQYAIFIVCEHLV